jgi:quercetin dioxygenase-like cupin family protein
MSLQLQNKKSGVIFQPAEFIIMFEDEKTKITSWRFDPGAETGWHRHDFDYVTIQKSSGRLKLEGENGEIKYIDYENDQTVGYAAPIKHNATNVSDQEIRVIEIEFKE